jgi:hypothetical protein
MTMQMTPAIIFGLVLFVFALACVPDKYRPAWTRRLGSWQTLIGLVAFIAAILIIMNPEFYALGILGDSAFFDLLVLAITCQLCVISSRVWSRVVAGLYMVSRFMRLQMYVTSSMLLFVLSDVAATVQKAVHRMSS